MTQIKPALGSFTDIFEFFTAERERFDKETERTRRDRKREAVGRKGLGLNGSDARLSIIFQGGAGKSGPVAVQEGPKPKPAGSAKRRLSSVVASPPPPTPRRPFLQKASPVVILPPTPAAPLITHLEDVAQRLALHFPEDEIGLLDQARRADRIDQGAPGGMGWADAIDSMHGADCHVFVDYSNIAVPYLQSTRGEHIPLSQSSLFLFLERGRPCSSRVLITSHNPTSLSPVGNFSTAKAWGYEVSILQRVKVPTDSSGSDSDQSPRFSNPRRHKEQAVDELLLLKLLLTLLTSPTVGTIVLASGDSSAHEFERAGFTKGVELAVQRGWAVEVVCWGRAARWKGMEQRLRKERCVRKGSTGGSLRVINMEVIGIDGLRSQ